MIAFSALEPLRPASRRPLPSRREFYRQYGRRPEPTVFTGGMGRWPAATRWSFAYFRERWGHVTVPVNTGRYDVYMTRTSMTLAEYIDWWWTPCMALTQGPPLAREVLVYYLPKHARRKLGELFGRG